MMLYVRNANNINENDEVCSLFPHWPCQ